MDGDRVKVSYHLSESGRVKIRTGFFDGPMLKTIADWEPMPPGENIAEWDGKDESGLVDIPSNKEYFLYQDLASEEFLNNSSDNFARCSATWKKSVI